MKKALLLTLVFVVYYVAGVLTPFVGNVYLGFGIGAVCGLATMPLAFYFTD